MELMTDKNKDEKKLFTPRGKEPVKGKMESKEDSWKPIETTERLQEG